MTKKFIAGSLLALFLFKWIFVFGEDTLNSEYLYYLDKDNNGKIDTFELVFNNELTGSLDFEKIKIYSSTGGLSNSIIETGSIFSSYSLSGTNLILNIIEQDNFLTGLTVNNGVTSHLRFKTNAGNGIKDIYGNEMKLLYGTSFDSYKKVSFKQNIVLEENTSSGITNIETGSGNLTSSGEILTSSGETLSGSLDEQNNLSNTGIELKENTSSGEILTNSGEILTNSGETLSGSLDEQNNFFNTGIELKENTSSGEIIEDIVIPDTKIEFQSPSYLLEKDSENISNYNCDQSKTDCKVNFNLLMNNSGSYKNILNSKYNCEWDFGIDEYFEEKYKCNPNTIVYPVGNFDVSYTITHISSGKKITKNLKINNLGYKEELNAKVVYSRSTETIIKTVIYIDEPKIEIQSGLDEQKNCKKYDCNLNLSYTPKNSKESCLWDFGGGVFSYGDDKKCNPGYIKYGEGEFQVKLKVYEIGNESNYKESFIKFFNKKIQEKEEETKEQIKEQIKEETKEETKEKLQLENKQKQIGNSYTGIIISSVLPNPAGNDNIEYIEIKNNSQDKVNLKNCELDDKIKGGSKSYKINQDLFLEPGKTKKFYKFNTDINIKNTSGDEVNLLCEDILIDTLKWLFDTPDDIIVDKKLIEAYNLKKLDFKISKTNITENIKNIVLETFSGSIDKPINKNIDKNLDKIIDDNFSQKIKKMRSGLKIYGKTFPNIKIIIKLDKQKQKTSFLFLKANADLDQYYETFSDNSGEYSILLNPSDIGIFTVKTYLDLQNDIKFEVENTSEIEIDKDDIDYMSYQKEIKKETKNDIYTPIKAHITLQKLSKNIQVSGNIITCKNTDKCRINFDGRESKGDIKNISWTVNDKEISKKINPSSFDFSTGIHLVNLKISDLIDEDNSTFIVKVEGKIKKDKQIKKTVEKEKKEEIKITNSGDFSIVPQVNAYDNNMEEKDLVFHLSMSLGLFFIFLFFSFILLRRKNII